MQMITVVVAILSLITHSSIMLTINKKIKDSSISSSITAIFHTTTILLIVFYTLRKYILEGFIDVNLFDIAAGISAGYFFVDFITLILSTKFSLGSRITYMCHHLITCAMIYVHVYSMMQCRVLELSVMSVELASLFANTHVLLKVYAGGNKKLRTINSFMLMVLFVLTRFVIVPFGYYMDMKCIYDETISNTKMINIILGLFTILNLYWANKIVNGFKKYTNGTGSWIANLYKNF